MILKVKDFKKVKFEAAFEIIGGREEEDPNVTPGGSELVGMQTATWSSDYNGVDGVEYCDLTYEPFLWTPLH